MNKLTLSFNSKKVFEHYYKLKFKQLFTVFIIGNFGGYLTITSGLIYCLTRQDYHNLIPILIVLYIFMTLFCIVGCCKKNLLPYIVYL